MVCLPTQQSLDRSKTQSIHQFGAASGVTHPDAEWEQLRERDHCSRCSLAESESVCPLSSERPSRRRARTRWLPSSPLSSTHRGCDVTADGTLDLVRLSLRHTAPRGGSTRRRISISLSPDLRHPARVVAGSTVCVGRCAVTAGAACTAFPWARQFARTGSRPASRKAEIPATYNGQPEGQEIAKTQRRSEFADGDRSSLDDGRSRLNVCPSALKCRAPPSARAAPAVVSVVWINER
jgi:hypothetical protein